jgi:hypothetical protein
LAALLPVEALAGDAASYGLEAQGERPRALRLQLQGADRLRCGGRGERLDGVHREAEFCGGYEDRNGLRPVSPGGEIALWAGHGVCQEKEAIATIDPSEFPMSRGFSGGFGCSGEKPRDPPYTCSFLSYDM